MSYIIFSWPAFGGPKVLVYIYTYIYIYYIYSLWAIQSGSSYVLAAFTLMAISLTRPRFRGVLKQRATKTWLPHNAAELCGEMATIPADQIVALDKRVQDAGTEVGVRIKIYKKYKIWIIAFIHIVKYKLKIFPKNKQIIPSVLTCWMCLVQ